MALLENLIVEPSLFQYDTGPEAQVGDQVKLFLDQDVNPGWPEFVFGTIQHPITKVNCESATSYIIEYDVDDLLVESLLTTGAILSGTAVVGQIQVVANELDQEIADRIADVLAAEAAATAALALEEAARIAADDAEEAARIAADDAEESARIAADDAEESARIAADALRVLITDGTSTRQTLVNPTEASVAIGNSGTEQTLSIAAGTFQTVTLTGNCVFTMPTPTLGKSLTLKVLSGAGGFTGTFTDVKWPNATPPTITATAARYDLLYFKADGTAWSGSFDQNYTV